MQLAPAVDVLVRDARAGLRLGASLRAFSELLLDPGDRARVRGARADQGRGDRQDEGQDEGANGDLLPGSCREGGRRHVRDLERAEFLFSRRV